MDQFKIVGKIYEFDDGTRLEVLQVKMREVYNQPSPVITYQVVSPTGIPRKLILEEKDFIHQYGHLFGIKEPPTFDPRG